MLDRFRKRRQVDQARRDLTSLGNILVDLGYLTRDQLSQAVATQFDRVPSLLGAVLLRGNAITKDQLEQALERQQVLRGTKGADTLKRYGPEQRQRVLEEEGREIKKIAEQSALLMERLGEEA